MIHGRAAGRLTLALLLAVSLPAASLPESIDNLLNSTSAARSAYWGIQIVDLGSGKTLYQKNSNHYFLPASNAKLFSTAMALTRLGPDLTFQTRITAAQPPDADGVLHGALRLVGGGDPNLSARAVPYRKGPVTGDPLAILADLAAQVTARGVKRVEGDVVGDDTWYVWEPYATGWAIDDPQTDDGAPVSALCVNDNVIGVTIRPGEAVGDPAVLRLNPPVEYYRFDNRIRTGAPGSPRNVRLARVPGSLDVQLWGTIPVRDRGEDLTIAIDDPALYAAKALRKILEDRGVAVVGGAAAEHFYPADARNLSSTAPREPDHAVELARHVSAPLVEDLRITDKVSQNLHAELALRAVGLARRNIGSFEAGLEELKTFLGEAGVDEGAYTLLDASGLSRLDLVTPEAVVRLLRYMYGSPAREQWISLLPVGGEDGTLGGRLGERATAGRIHAKTGSLSHVSALSGYAERRGGQWVAFSILANNYNGSTADIRAAIDRICALIVE